MTERHVSFAINSSVFLLTGGALLLAIFSVRWPLVHDLAIMLYDGFLISDLGLSPYRDFFEINPPGTLALYTFLHYVTQGEDVLLRLADFAILLSIGAFTTAALRRYGWKAGVMASASFTILYLTPGPMHALQRELFCVLFLSASAALVWAKPDLGRTRWAGILLGVLAGAAVAIKPPTLLFWLPILLGTLSCAERKACTSIIPILASLVKTSVFFLLGLSISLAACLIWLMRSGAVADFWEIAVQYYPLYNQIDGFGSVYGAGVVAFFTRYIAQTLPLLGTGPVAVLAFLGLRLRGDFSDRRLGYQAVVLALLVCATLIYIPVSGKFWPYHQFPFFYALSLCAGLTVAKPLARSPLAAHSILVLVAALTFLPLSSVIQEFQMWRKGEVHSLNGGTENLLTAYLQNNTKAEETILPLDATRGAIHALYRLRRPLHGRFIYDFQFYHHVHSPYIINLRREILGVFTHNPPDIVLQMSGWRPTGRTCSGEFPELDSLLRQDYTAVRTTDCALILRRHLSDSVRTNTTSTHRLFKQPR